MFVCDCNFEFAKSKYFAIKHTMLLDLLFDQEFYIIMHQSS